MSNPSFHVRPRYTPGSPAWVHEGLARRVAQEEAHAIEAELEGVYGEKHVERAKLLGLHRIAYILEEKGGGFTVTDLLTHEQYRREPRYRVNEPIDVWDDERGWVPHVVTGNYTGFAPAVWVRPANAEAWEAVSREVCRDRVRATRSVRVLTEEAR
jgi:hypothetical protein